MKRWTAGFVLLSVFSLALPLWAGYRSVLNQWTHSTQMYSAKDLQAKVIWHATFFSPDFRRAHAKRHIEKKYLGPVEAAQYLAAQERKQSEVQEFFVAVYARKSYRHITSGEDTFWEMVLTTASGEVVEPALVEPVGVHPYEEVMFPYLNRWSKGYRVLFPKADLGNSFSLTLRSVIGQSTLRWH